MMLFQEYTATWLLYKHLPPVIQLVLMTHWISAQHVPLIYSMQVNFVMFSFKTAIWKKTEMTKTCKYYPWQVLQLTFSPPNSQKLVLSLKKCCKNPILADNEMFYYFASWQRVAEVDGL